MKSRTSRSRQSILDPAVASADVDETSVVVAAENTSVDELAESSNIVQPAASSSTESTADSASTLDGEVLVASTDETSPSESRRQGSAIRITEGLG